MNLFQPATRAQIPLKLGIVGPSGSGKTTAALRLARGLVGDGRIALLDTENGSASLYSDITPFHALNMRAPYATEKFIAAIEAAHAEGFNALIIDSASHEWIQILQDKEAMDARGGNNWTNWAGFTKKHELFLASLRQAPMHIICCLRAKERHEMNDAKKVVKLGMGSEMRPGFEYEMTTVFDVAMDHNAKTSKDRTRLFDGRIWSITEATGRELVDWLSSGKELAENTGESFQPPEPAPPPPAEPRAPAIPEKEYGAKAGEVFQGMQEEITAAKAEPSQAASAFVDSLEPETSSRITLPEFAELTDLCIKNKVPIDKLQQYCMGHDGYLEGVTMNTLVRAKLGPLTALISDPAKRRGLMAALDNLTTTAA